MKKSILYVAHILLVLLLVNCQMGWTQNFTEMEHKELKSSQGIWRYLVNGDGDKAILFIHGASSSKQIWKNQYSLSAEGYKNLFVDLLGYGESDKPASGYSLRSWIVGIHSILEQENINEVCIVAHSNGVIFAKEYYRNYPQKVANLILLDGMLKPMIPPQMLDWMRSTLERSDYETFMASNIDNMPVEGLSKQDAELLKNDGLNTPKRVTTAELKLVSDTTTWEAIHILCPTTIVHSNNPSWNESYVKWLPTIVSNLNFIEWKDAGHFIQLQYPERLKRLILDSVKSR